MLVHVKEKCSGGVNKPSFSQAATNASKKDNTTATTATTFILTFSSRLRDWPQVLFNDLFFLNDV